MDELIKGDVIVKGRASGVALVSKHPFSFFTSVDPKTGVVVEMGHEWEGLSLAGRILVFPHGKGSSASSYVIYEMARCGTQPAGIINLRADSIIVSGAVLSRIPMIDRPDADVLSLIQNGDHIQLDAETGIIKVGKRIERELH